MAFGLQNSITFKVLGIGALALLMLIPLAYVQDLVRERSGLRAQALGNIEQGWGGAQRLGGPVLAIPKRWRVQTSNGWVVHEGTELVLADQLNIEGTLAPEWRHYGIYSAPVYVGELKVSGRFLDRDVRSVSASSAATPPATKGDTAGAAARVASVDAAAQGEGSVSDATYLLDQAELRLNIADVRGIRRISTLKLDGKEYAFGPASGSTPHAIAVPVDLRQWSGDTHVFELELSLAGAQSLQFLPFARTTTARVAAPWSNPSFGGAFLPPRRSVDTTGFDAQWQVLDLNRSYGQHWQEGALDPDSDAFGVSLYQPADLYAQNDRAGKYGVLFVALTFVAFFLFEVLKKLRVHPVQYLLVGLALTTFYVVLLALSEKIGFALAYLVAATAMVALVGGYASAVLRARRAGAMLGAALALIYVLLYGLIVSEQYSLLMGAAALLAVVAALMYLTRHVDWSKPATAG